MAKSRNVKLLQGNEAVVEGALAAGLKFYAGYPITPSTEIAEILAAKLPRINGRFIQMEDEIASIAAIIGGSLTGLKSMTATSGPGFSLMQENIGYAAITETPIVIANVQRVGPSTGWPTGPAQGDVMQARWGTHGDHPVAVVTPGSVQQCYTLTIEAFNIAEKFRVPVIILTDEVVGHMRENVALPKANEISIVNRKKPSALAKKYIPFNAKGSVPAMASFGDGYRFHVTGLTHDENGAPTGKPVVVDALLRRLEDKMQHILEYAETIEEFQTEDADIVIFAYGCVARSALQAMYMAREEGIKVGVLQPLMLWPFDSQRIGKALQGKKVIVAEMNLGQMASTVKSAVEGGAEVVSYTRVDGEIITPEELLQKVLEVK